MAKHNHSELGKNTGHLNKSDIKVVRNKKKKSKARPRSAKKLPPIKREELPETGMSPEDAFLREWTSKILDD